MLSSYMTRRKRCADHIIAYIKTDAIEYILSTFYRSFHRNTSFTCKKENNGKISSLESIRIIRARFNICDNFFWNRQWLAEVDYFQKNLRL